MNGYCEVNINNKKVGVLFGVRLFEICKEEKLDKVIVEKPKSSEAMINVVYAAIKNNCDFEAVDMELTRKDIYIWANEEPEEFEKVLICFSKSKMIGKINKKPQEEVKKKTTKKSVFGRIFAKLLLVIWA